MASRVTRPCQRSDCPAPARAGVQLNHPERFAVLVDLPGDRDPRVMELCGDHAQRATVPLGWELHDERVAQEPVAPPTGPPSVTELRSTSTVETLAAALHGHGDAAHPLADDDRDEVPETVATMAELLDRVATPGDLPAAHVDDPPPEVAEAAVPSPAPAGAWGEQPELPLELRLPRPVPGAARG